MRPTLPPSGQADTLMKESNGVIEKANIAMNEVTSSMDEISKASLETQKIVKTIDEIAFQTNLLALNHQKVNPEQIIPFEDDDFKDF